MTVPDSRRALTVRQPWASLLMLPGEHRKDVENRSKPIPWTIKAEGRQCVLPSGTVQPFRLWIHAARSVRSYPLGTNTVLPERFEVERDQAGLLLRGPIAWPYRLPLGALLGSVVVTDCHHADTCEHICPEAGCDDCDDAHGRCGHDASWPSAPGSDPSDDAPPARCDLTGLACMNLCSPWAEHDVWHIVTTDPEPLPEPIPAKGRLGWWRLPEGVPA